MELVVDFMSARGSPRDAGITSTWASSLPSCRLYLLYVDPSGNPELTDHSQCYVVLGLCIHESVWAPLEREVRQLRQRFDLAELHALALCQQIREQDSIPDFELLGYSDRRRALAELERGQTHSEAHKKRARQVREVLHLDRRERNLVFETALDLVQNLGEISLFAEVVDKAHAAEMKKASSSVEAEGKHQDLTGIAESALTQVVSRFDYFLNGINKASRRHSQSGLLVMDREPKREDLIRQMVGSFRDHGHRWGKLTNIIETPFFVDSSLASAIQLADLCSYALRRYVEKPNREGSFEEANFRRISDRFLRSNGKLHGLRHYTRRGCSCRICKERDH